MKTIIIPITLRLRFEEPPKLVVRTKEKREHKISWKPNTFKRWTPDEYRKILTPTDGKGIRRIAKTIGRTPQSVMTKRWWLTKGVGKNKIKL